MPSNCKLPDPSGVVALSGVGELGQPEGGRSDLTQDTTPPTHMSTLGHIFVSSGIIRIFQEKWPMLMKRNQDRVSKEGSWAGLGEPRPVPPAGLK